MAVHLSFLTAVALAGVAFFVGERLLAVVRALERLHVPEPIVGGLLVAFVLLALRAVGLEVTVPTHGRSLDFLVGLLTANMGLHVTPALIRRGLPVLLLFIGAAGLLFAAQLAVALPAAMASTDADAIDTGVVWGPLSFVGAPYNLNPPSQIGLVQGHLDGIEDLERTARGAMMVGVLAGAVLPGLLARRLLAMSGAKPEAPSPTDQRDRSSVWRFARREVDVVVAVLAIVAAAFLVQEALLGVFVDMSADHIPVIVVAYLIGVTFRCTAEAVRPGRFPAKPLTAVLVGPTMAIVLTYAVMSIPLVTLAAVTPAMVVAGLLAVTASALVALAVWRIAQRFVAPYEAIVIATVLFASTTAWGPVAMAHLRRLMGEEGKVPPMPVILPLSAVYAFPWLAALLTRAVA